MIQSWLLIGGGLSGETLPVIFHNIPEDERAAETRLPAVGESITPLTAKNLALNIALKGAGNVAPNPLVGAIIVDEAHNFLGAGAHLRVGAAHAEINATEAARAASGRKDFSGCTLYVTLEPCAHENRTPACAKAVIREKFKQVVCGTLDPNPKVAGKGRDMVRAAGIACDIADDWTASARRLAEIFLWETKTGQPFVGLKSAISLDGAIARRGDQRQFITGKRARAFGHFLRVKYDAIVVGAWTLMHDNPNLTPRESTLPGRTPWRVVVDPNGRGLQSGLTGSVHLLQEGSEKVVWILTPNAQERLQQITASFPHVTFLSIAASPAGFIEPAELLAQLYKLGITSVLLEGGSGLYKPFLLRNMVNRYHLFQAAKFLSGSNKINLFEGDVAPFETSPELIEITPLGPDWLTEFNVKE